MLTFINSASILHNTASTAGGGVYDQGTANLTLDDKTKFNDNAAPVNKGDGINWVAAMGGTLTNNADMGNNSVDMG